MSTEEKQIKLEKRKFQSRMGLAYLSFAAQVIFTVLLWFFVPDNRLEIVSGMSPYVYFSFTTIMGAAMGLKSWSELKK